MKLLKTAWPALLAMEIHADAAGPAAVRLSSRPPTQHDLLLAEQQLR